MNMRQALFAQDSAEVPIFLLTITHPQLANPILLSSDPTTRLSTDPLSYGTVSRSSTYLYVGMEVSLPDEQDKAPPTATLIISNVDRSIIPLARSVISPPSVLMECVLASDLDTVEFSAQQMQMSNVVYDAGSLTFDLVVDALANEPFPAGSFDPASFPGLFVKI